MVWHAFQGDNQHDQLRMDVLVRYLKDRATRHRIPNWDGAKPWLDNALVEHLHCLHQCCRLAAIEHVWPHTETPNTPFALSAAFAPLVLSATKTFAEERHIAWA